MKHETFRPQSNLSSVQTTNQFAILRFGKYDLEQLRWSVESGELIEAVPLNFEIETTKILFATENYTVSIDPSAGIISS